MSKTENTKIRYLKSAKLILKRYKKSQDISWRDDPILFAQWFVTNPFLVAHNTWRSYKAAIIYYMHKRGPKEATQILKDATWDQVQQPPEKQKNLKGNTSQQKDKKFKQEDLDEILQYLAPKRGQFDAVLAGWLVVNMKIGLRPSEYETAVLSDDLNELVVQNAKHTNGRACGPTRTLILTGMQKKHKENIANLLEVMHKIMETRTFHQFYNLTRIRLHYITRKLWPKRKTYPTLYSTRHQCAADMKSKGYSKKEIAAIMGHASDATAGLHYGKKCYGHYGNGKLHEVTASEENKAQVREVSLKKKIFHPVYDLSLKK